MMKLATGATLGILASQRGTAAEEAADRKARPKMLIFDVNETLLNLGPLNTSVADALGGRTDLVELWFTTMLQYSLVETTSGSYRKFGEIGAAVLTMIAADHQIPLELEDAKRAIKPITSLPAHPDVKDGLRTLKNAGYRMITLTNSPQEGVDAQITFAGLDEFFEARLTVGDIRTYKPDLRTYRWAADKIGLPLESCMLVAAHGWDITGALRSGMRAAFLARPGKSLYPSEVEPELVSEDLKALADVLVRMPG